MAALPPRSVHLVVTSPPYPMIEMWDDVFSSQSGDVAKALERDDGPAAFECMHELLDATWRQVWRVLVPGGFACINIGDATRTIGDEFALFPNHARILQGLLEIGRSVRPGRERRESLMVLPAILWRKQTNAPNKFMGSGMLPAGAYVTLEHEYVLIVRKGGKREFSTAEEKANRRASAFFWEERNEWFSDVWLDLKGTRQWVKDDDARDRSAAFPFELPYRLISMFSVRGDTVLDPFLGVGTTMQAAMATARNSVGFEIDASLGPSIAAEVPRITDMANARIGERLQCHEEFVRERHETKGTFGYRNAPHGFPVVTRQEKELGIHRLESVTQTADAAWEVEYAEAPEKSGDEWEWFFAEGEATPPPPRKKAPRAEGERVVQLDLFDLPPRSGSR